MQLKEVKKQLLKRPSVRFWYYYYKLKFWSH